MAAKIVRRYTNLPATLHILNEKCLTLLSPNSWDDRNDAFFISEFQAQCGAQSVLALCFAEAPQTYHHWRVFSAGSDGVCLEFDKAKLLKALKRDKRIISRSVEYKKIRAAKLSGVAEIDLPFVKRHPYKDEKEFRILLVDMDEAKEFEHAKIALDSITRITLSPWMPKPLAKAVTSTLKGIQDCSKLKVSRSTLIENEMWKRVANQKLK